MTENAFYPRLPHARRSRSCSCSSGRRSRASSPLLALVGLAFRDARAGGRARARAPDRAAAARRCSSGRPRADAGSGRSYALVGAGAVAVLAVQLARGRSRSAICSAPTRSSATRATTCGDVAALLPLPPGPSSTSTSASSRSRRFCCSPWSRGARRSRASALLAAARRADRSRCCSSSPRSRPSFANRIQERNTFVVAPLFLIALLAWVDRGRRARAGMAPRPWPSLWLRRLAIPFERFIDTGAISDTLRCCRSGGAVRVAAARLDRRRPCSRAASLAACALPLRAAPLRARCCRRSSLALLRGRVSQQRLVRRARLPAGLGRARSSRDP